MDALAEDEVKRIPERNICRPLLWARIRDGFAAVPLKKRGGGPSGIRTLDLRIKRKQLGHFGNCGTRLAMWEFRDAAHVTGQLICDTSMHRLLRRGERARGRAPRRQRARTRIDGHQRLAARGTSVARDSPPGSRARGSRPDARRPARPDGSPDRRPGRGAARPRCGARGRDPDAHWERPAPAEGGVLRDGIAHLAEGDARARGVAETRRPLWPLSPSPGRPPRRGALTGRQVDAPARSGAERVDGWRTERDHVRRALRTCAARDRLPWAGRRMRARSFATSRLADW